MNERMEEFEARITDRLTVFEENIGKNLSSLTTSFQVIKILGSALIVLSLAIAYKVFFG